MTGRGSGLSALAGQAYQPALGVALLLVPATRQRPHLPAAVPLLVHARLVARAESGRSGTRVSRWQPSRASLLPLDEVNSGSPEYTRLLPGDSIANRGEERGGEKRVDTRVLRACATLPGGWLADAHERAGIIRNVGQSVTLRSQVWLIGRPLGTLGSCPRAVIVLELAERKREREILFVSISSREQSRDHQSTFG